MHWNLTQYPRFQLESLTQLEVLTVSLCIDSSYEVLNACSPCSMPVLSRPLQATFTSPPCCVIICSSQEQDSGGNSSLTHALLYLSLSRQVRIRWLIPSLHISLQPVRHVPRPSFLAFLINVLKGLLTSYGLLPKL